MTHTTHTFTGNKPSRARVLKTLKGLVAGSVTQAEVHWGENSISLEWDRCRYFGWGWIKDVSGSDLADDLNNTGSASC
jgi:hypothetical protein